MKIGRKLRAFRKEREMTLKALSKRSGVAIATLSRMEHGIMTGTLTSHTNICRALGVSLADFYREIETEGKVVTLYRRGEKNLGPVRSRKASVEILTTKVIDKKMMPVLMRIAKAAGTAKEENKPDTEKFIYVIEGKITALIGKEKHVLNARDSLYFDATLPHTFANIGNKDALIICVSSPHTL